MFNLKANELTVNGIKYKIIYVKGDEWGCFPSDVICDETAPSGYQLRYIDCRTKDTLAFQYKIHPNAKIKVFDFQVFTLRVKMWVPDGSEPEKIGSEVFGATLTLVYA